MAKMKVLRETAKWPRLGAKGYETGPGSTKSHKTRFFRHF